MIEIPGVGLVMEPEWEEQLRRARLLLLYEGGREALRAIALAPHTAGPMHRCRQCFRCACLQVIVDDNEALAGGPSW